MAVGKHGATHFCSRIFAVQFHKFSESSHSRKLPWLIQFQTIAMKFFHLYRLPRDEKSSTQQKSQRSINKWSNNWLKGDSWWPESKKHPAKRNVLGGCPKLGENQQKKIRCSPSENSRVYPLFSEHSPIFTLWSFGVPLIILDNPPICIISTAPPKKITCHIYVPAGWVLTWTHPMFLTMPLP